MAGLIPVEKKLDLREVKQFLNSEGIGVAFTSYWMANRAHLIDQKPVVVSSDSELFYYNALPDPDLSKLQPFAIISTENGGQFIFHYKDRYLVRKTNHKDLSESSDTILYKTLLEKNEIQYKKNRIGSYTVFWDFRGDDSHVEDLWAMLKGDPALHQHSREDLGLSLKNIFMPKYNIK
jgi:hypothetical protein